MHTSIICSKIPTETRDLSFRELLQINNNKKLKTQSKMKWRSKFTYPMICQVQVQIQINKTPLSFLQIVKPTSITPIITRTIIISSKSQINIFKAALGEVSQDLTELWLFQITTIDCSMEIQITDRITVITVWTKDWIRFFFSNSKAKTSNKMLPRAWVKTDYISKIRFKQTN
jgi:hypothetical protein